MLTLPPVICHDQEPLHWNHYTDQQPEMRQHRHSVNQAFLQDTGVHDWLQLHDLNLAQGTVPYSGISIYDNPVLLHSEINSRNLEVYREAGYATSYWLSHAAISRDWYRFAQHDHRLRPAQQFQPFLIYSRGFLGSREYRPKFLEYIMHHQLLPFCQVSCLQQEQTQDLVGFRSHNPIWRVDLPHLLRHIPSCDVSSTASAGYDTSDINSTACQIVLETQFDGTCLHLTEKTFRPLATGQAFILLAAPGALALLRRYGFETFDGLIDESYDSITDAHDRMLAVIHEMIRLAQMPASSWSAWRQRAVKIAERNQSRFFSQDFENMIWDECTQNLNQALIEIHDTRGKNWLRQRRLLREIKPLNWHHYLGRANERIKAAKLRQLRQGL